MHYGDCMSIRVANRYIPARVELDTHWYVFIDDLKFRLHPKEQYVKIEVSYIDSVSSKRI
ncbi:DUF5348 domain-containing protein [Desulfoscipio gibsoniae]|uniref:DUF5348 domain-containing protein n=1 Tax=Desulfoscipio gibsoniae TaxID=102134 RepID=UPI00338DF6B3